MPEWTIADCTNEERRGYVLGIQNALWVVRNELVKMHDRWSTQERLAVAEATLAIVKLNIENLLY